MGGDLQINVKVDLEGLVSALRSLGKGNLPRTAQAVSDLTLRAQQLWLGAASGKAVTFQGRSFTIQRVTGEYARSIQDGLEYPADGNPLIGRVTSNSKYARQIEDGITPYDMKPGLLAGDRARVSKKGTRYTIVPFRHGTPNAKTMAPMPMEIYEQARKLSYSVRTGEFAGTNADGKPVNRYSYRWGGKIGNTAIGWRSRIQPAEHAYTHTTSIYSGMVRMGSPKQSSFMTFRVCSENSNPNSWQHPGVDPKPIAQAVAEMLEGQATRIIRLAIEEDLHAHLGGQNGV